MTTEGPAGTQVRSTGFLFRRPRRLHFRNPSQLDRRRRGDPAVPYHERCAYDLERWGGRWRSFHPGDAGDGAVFGAPVARGRTILIARSCQALRDPPTGSAEEGASRCAIAVNNRRGFGQPSPRRPGSGRRGWPPSTRQYTGAGLAQSAAADDGHPSPGENDLPRDVPKNYRSSESTLRSRRRQGRACSGVGEVVQAAGLAFAVDLNTLGAHAARGP